MLKRLKQLWKLTNKDPKALEILASLSKEQIAIIPEEGDGKAVFFGEGTKEEYEDFLKEEDGTKEWYERMKNL